MSFINYDVLSDVIDKRMIKSRSTIFKSLVSLLAEKPLEKITVSELCKRGEINRNTFYFQFSSVRDAFESMEIQIIDSYLSKLIDVNVLSYGGFRPAEFIFYTDKLRQEYRYEFDTIYPTLRSSKFFRHLGTQLSFLEKKYFQNRQDETDQYPGRYVSALIFSITGLMNMYFDWIDDGMPVPIHELAYLAEDLLKWSLNKLVNSKPQS